MPWRLKGIAEAVEDLSVDPERPEALQAPEEAHEVNERSKPKPQTGKVIQADPHGRGDKSNEPKVKNYHRLSWFRCLQMRGDHRLITTGSD